jgi:hypothetical protein
MVYTGAARLYERIAAEFNDGAHGGRIATLTEFCKPSK